MTNDAGAGKVDMDDAGRRFVYASIRNPASPMTGFSTFPKDFAPMSRNTKVGLIALGSLTALFLLSQLVMGQLILSGRVNLIKAHQHTGYTTVVLAILYVGFSLAAIVSLPTRSKS